MALAFRAAVGRGVVDVKTFRAQARGGTLQGTARLSPVGQLDFKVDATATALNPASFGNYPVASLSGKASAQGALKPAWSAALSFELGRNSSLRGRPLAGAGKLALSPGNIRDARVELERRRESTELDRQFRPQPATRWSSRWMRAIPRRSMRGSADVCTPAARSAGTGIDRRSRSRRRRGPPRRHRTCRGNPRCRRRDRRRHAGSCAARFADGDRAARRRLCRAKPARECRGHARASPGEDRGSRQCRRCRCRVRQPARRRMVRRCCRPAHGAARSPRCKARDKYPLALAQPAELEAGAQGFHVASLRGTIAGGRFAVDELRWQHGRLSSRGEFASLPAAPLLDFTGAAARLSSTLTLAGRWSFTATPRITGSLVAIA